MLTNEEYPLFERNNKRLQNQVQKQNKGILRKEAARTVSALPLMARRHKISSPSRGYQMQLNIAIPWQEVTVLSSWNRYACQLTANNSKPSYSQNWTRVNSGHIGVSKQRKPRNKRPKLGIIGNVVLEWQLVIPSVWIQGKYCMFEKNDMKLNWKLVLRIQRGRV